MKIVQIQKVLNGETTGKLIKHPLYGDCLISKSIPAYGPLKLWKIKIFV